MSARTMLSAALHLAVDLEQPIIPLVPRAKNPLVKRGLRAATTDEATVRRWWTLWPDANIGLILGRGIIALDIDGPTGAKSLAALERQHAKLPATVEAVTARGRHIFFSVSDDAKIRPSVGALGEKIDVRGDGSYVVAPPSIHPSGFVYRWKRGHAPGQHVLADAPAWLLEAIGRAHTHAVPGSGRGSRKQHECVGPRRRFDRTSSGVDFHLSLEMMRAGADDDEVTAKLKRASKKYAARGDSYITSTVDRARIAHEANAPRAKVREARLEFLPERFGHPDRTRVVLQLVTADGEIVIASIVVPSPAYPQARETWNACLADVDPAGLIATRWPDVRRAWEAIVWKGRAFHVAARDGQVRWIRAAADPEFASRGVASRAQTRPRRSAGAR